MGRRSAQGLASDPDVRYVGRMLRVLAALCLLITTARGDDALVAGRVLDASTAAAADGLMPPEMVGHYKAGDFKNAIGAWPKGPVWDETFDLASKKNADRFDVNERGTIVDKAS